MVLMIHTYIRVSYILIKKPKKYGHSLLWQVNKLICVNGARWLLQPFLHAIICSNINN